MKKSRHYENWQRNAIAVAVASCFAITSPVYANPIGADVVSGVVSMAQQGNALNITNSPGAIINWQSFSIGVNEATRFIQQSAASGVLNRVTGVDPSSILGALQSNGRVLLINPNGVLFGAGAQVDVAGLVVSTLNLSNADFLAGRYNFTANANARGIDNQGSLTALPGGQIYLVAPDISNSGIITSPQGDVILAAGNSVELVNANTPDMRVVIDAPGNQALNLGSIVANSGRVGIYAGLINHHGIVSANTATVGATGKIVFKATKDINFEPGSVISASGTAGGVKDGGEVRIIADGKLAMRQGSQVHVDGGADGGNGGFLELSGKTGFSLLGSYTGRALVSGYRNGGLLLDPTNININSGCGATPSSGCLTPAQLDAGGFGNISLLASTDINVYTAIGNGNINSGVAGGYLTLTAGNDITIGAQIGEPSSVGAGRFAHDLTLTAGNNVNVNSSIYLGNNTLTLAADATTPNGSGNVNINPSVKVDTIGAMNISGVDLTVGGSSASARTTVFAGGLLTINMSRDINIYGGSASSGSINKTLVQGSSVDLHGRNLLLRAGVVGGGMYANGSSNANAEIRSTAGNVDITLTGGGLTLVGNNVTSASSYFCCGSRSADAIIYSAQDVVIHSANSVTLSGASSVSASASGFPASGNAVIEAVRDVSITTTGALALNGGTAAIQGSGDSMYAHADAKIISGQDINITAGSLSLQGGVATTSINCCTGSATAKAEISATRSVLLKTDGAVNVAGGSASRPSSGSAHASAKINAGSGDLTITGNVNTGVASLTLAGGTRSGGGGPSNSAAAQLHASSGTATINVGGDLTLNGGSGDYAYAQIFGNPDVGSAAQPVVVGGVIRMNDGTGTNAFARIESGLIPSIYIHFPNLYTGGYFVNGVESVVADTNTGFFASGMAAILNSNLHITYGLSPPGSTPSLPPAAQLALNTTTGAIDSAGNPAAPPPVSQPSGEEGDEDDPKKKLYTCQK